MSSDGDLFDQLIQNPFPTNHKQTHSQYQALQALTSAPSNALAQGNVLLKISCGNEIRCRSVSEDYGWEDLQYMVQQMFAGQISPRDPMTLRFKDPEGDWVTMGGEDEFNLAKQLTPKLHISVSQKGLAKQEITSVPQLRSELVRLRDEINRILEHMQNPSPTQTPPSPPVPAPPETKKLAKEPDVPVIPSVLEMIEESQPRTVSPHASAVHTERTPQYSNLGQLPTAILPNPSQPYSEKTAPVPHYQPPVSVPALPTAPSLGSASSLFHAQTAAFPVAPPTSAPYPPQAFGHPQTHPAPYNQYYPHPGLYRPN